MDTYPQVLLLGNGINQAYGGISWSSLLKDISVRDDFDVEKLTSPMPLQAILVTNNNLKDAMKSKSELFSGELKTETQKSILQQLLIMGFDDILTTNYSYELEAVGLSCKKVSVGKLKSITRRTSSKVENRYFLHTYNAVSCNGSENRIWHIHGESRKPDSMILGHYWYGNLLGKIKIELEGRKNRYHYRQTHGLPIECDSWVDSFILGDVYVLGFGFGLAELDLWWLLNRKYREKAETGKVYFYEPSSVDTREKTALLRLLDVDVRNLGYGDDQTDRPLTGEEYKQFYEDAIRDINQNLSEKRGICPDIVPTRFIQN